MNAGPVVPAWADIQPKVTAAAVAYAGSTVVMSILEHEIGMAISATTSAGASGFVMLLFAYMMPNGRHGSSPAGPVTVDTLDAAEYASDTKAAAAYHDGT